MKVYVVTGECGSHSDWRTWDVCAYEHLEQAQAHALAANAEVNEQERKYTEAWANGLPSFERFNKFDPGFGTESWSYELKYTVKTIQVFCHFDQFQESVGL